MKAPNTGVESVQLIMVILYSMASSTYEDLCNGTKIVLELVVSVDDGATNEDLGLGHDWRYVLSVCTVFSGNDEVGNKDRSGKRGNEKGDGFTTRCASRTYMESGPVTEEEAAGATSCGWP